MKIQIDEKIFNQYPHCRIGWLIADIKVEKNSDYVEILKQSISHKLKEMCIDKSNYKENNIIISWKKVFADFHRQNYVSSITALIKRVVNEEKIWNINNIVDIYNCYSILSLTPMGAYDIDNIQGDITLRYGKNDDKFMSLGAETEQIVNDKEIVYADEEKVLCWLWNYRESKFTCITENTKKAIFFFDSVLEYNNILEKVDNFVNYLNNINATVINYGVLNKDHTFTDLHI